MSPKDESTDGFGITDSVERSMGDDRRRFRGRGGAFDVDAVRGEAVRWAPSPCSTVGSFRIDLIIVSRRSTADRSLDAGASSRFSLWGSRQEAHRDTRRATH